MISEMVPASRSPYRGILPFRYVDRATFFGRAREVNDLVAKILLYRLVVVFGESGSGKSSLLSAGILPALRHEEFQPEWLRVRPLAEAPMLVERIPIGEGSEVLPSIFASADQGDSRSVACSLQQFRAALKMHAAGTAVPMVTRSVGLVGEGTPEGQGTLRSVLIFDQFEELFTLFEEGLNPLRASVLDLIYDVISSRELIAKVVLVVREDFLGKLEVFAKQYPQVFEQRMKLRQLPADAAREAILGACYDRLPPSKDAPNTTISASARWIRRAHVYPSEIIPEVADLIVHDFTKGDDGISIHSTELQIVCSQLWNRFAASRSRLTADEYRSLGGMDGILADFLTSQITKLPPEERDLAYLLMGQLVTGAGTRDVVSADRLRHALRSDARRLERAFASDGTLHALQQLRLINRTLLRGTYYYEVASEYLIPPVTRHNRAREMDLERLEFARREHEARRRLRKARGVALLFAFLTGIATISFVYARYQRQRAVARQSLFLAALAAQDNRDGNHGLAARLALEALPKGVAEPERLYAPEAGTELYAAMIGMRELVAYERHRGSVGYVTFSPDGGRLLTASDDGTAIVWDVKDGTILATLEGHEGLIWHAAWSPDGRRIVTSSQDGTARLWEAANGHCDARLQHESAVKHAAFTVDGSRVVTVSEDGLAKVWQCETGDLLFRLEGHHGPINHVSVSADGSRIVTSSWDKTAIVWDAGSGTLLLRLEGHANSIHRAYFDRAGTHVVTASEDGTARVWDVRNERPPIVLEGHRGKVWDATFNTDGDRIVTASEDGTARVWLASGGPATVVLQGHQRPVSHAEFSPDGAHIVTASWDRTARLWNSNAGTLVAILGGHEERVCYATFNPDGSKVATASADRSARIWRVADSDLLVQLKGHERQVNHASYSADGARVVTASWDGTARIWPVNGGAASAELTGHAGPINHAEFSPDGKYVITASWDWTARLWSAEPAAHLATLSGHQNRVWHASFSPSSTQVVTASWDRTARVWDVPTGKLTATLDGHQGAVNHAFFSPDGERIVTTSDDQTARVWDAKRGVVVTTLGDGHGPMYGAAFSPDGSRIVTGSAKGAIQLWNAVNGALVLAPTGHDDAVNSVAFNSDGTRIVSASKDRTARIWETASGRLLATLTGHRENVNYAAFSPDGRWVITSSWDTTARLWDATTGKLVLRLDGHQGQVNHAVFGPDGKTVLTASWDGTARIWRVFPDIQGLMERAQKDIPRVSHGVGMELRASPIEENLWLSGD